MNDRPVIAALVLTLISAFIFCACAPDNTSDVYESQTPDTAVSATVQPTERTDDTTDDFVFDTYTAEYLIPPLQALLESYLLMGPDTSFPPEDVTDKTAYDYLYAYAQANAFVEGEGAYLSDFEVQELLTLAFGQSYSYEMFRSASDEFDLVHDDGAWGFGSGESLLPEVRYASDEDLTLSDMPFIYKYTDPFEESSGTISVEVEPDVSSTYSVRIVSIKLNKD